MGIAQGLGALGALVVSMFALQVASSALVDQKRINESQARVDQLQRDVVERRYAGRVAVWDEMVENWKGPWPKGSERNDDGLLGVVHIVNRSPIALTAPKLELRGSLERPNLPGYGSIAFVRVQSHLVIPPCTEAIFPAGLFFVQVSDGASGDESTHAFDASGINQISFSDGVRVWSVSIFGLAKGEWTAPWSGEAGAAYRGDPLDSNQKVISYGYDAAGYRTRDVADCGEGS
jgi:hypothetical protein